MKKIILRLLLSLLLLAGAYGAYRLWLLHGTAPHTVSCIYSSGSAVWINADSLLAGLDQEGLHAEAVESEDPFAAALEALQDGSTILIVSLDTAPANFSILDAAAARGATLFFVGEYPGDAFLAAYDKAYYVGSRAEYAGELAGDAAAQAFRSGAAADINQDQLLAYLSTDADTAVKQTWFSSLLQESEHYGVYTADAVSPYVQDSITADDAESVDAAESSASSISQAADPWSNLAYAPEMIVALGAEDFAQSRQYASNAGWLSRELPPYWIGFAMGARQAAQMRQDGCNAVVYYDADSVTDTILKMVMNISRQDYVAESTGYSPDPQHAVWVPYQLLADASSEGSAASGTS